MKTEIKLQALFVFKKIKKKKKTRGALSFMEEDKINQFFYEIQTQELDG